MKTLFTLAVAGLIAVTAAASAQAAGPYYGGYNTGIVGPRYNTPYNYGSSTLNRDVYRLERDAYNMGYNNGHQVGHNYTNYNSYGYGGYNNWNNCPPVRNTWTTPAYSTSVYRPVGYSGSIYLGW